MTRPKGPVQRWREVRQAATRRHGPGVVADREAAGAVKRLLKWVAKQRAASPVGVTLHPRPR